MKKRIITIAFFIISIISINVSAQSLTIGVRGGIDIPNLTNGGHQTPLSTGYSSRFASDFAVLGEVGITRKFSIRAMVEYSEQGGKKDGLQAFATPPQYAQYLNQPYVYANYKSTAKMNYILIPVLAKVSWNLGNVSPLSLYVDAGPFVGFLISAHQITSGSSLMYADAGEQNPLSNQMVNFDANTNIKDQLRKNNWGISGNIGLALHFRRNSVFIEGGGNYGFVNIQKYKADGENHTGAATITVGFTHKLGI